MRRINPSLALLIVLLVTFALRVFRLNLQSLWYDEAFSVYLAHFSIVEITGRTAADIQPPLYYYLLHYWIALAGDGEFALRFLSLLFGVLTVPLLYVTARRLFNPTAGLICALLAMLAPLYVWYSQEARMYTLITFLLLLSSYALLRALESKDSRAWWLVFALSNIAAVYTHYFAFVVIAFQFVYALSVAMSHFLLKSKFEIRNSKPVDESHRELGIANREFRISIFEFRIIASFAAILLAFLPWTPFVVARFGQDASYWQGALKLDEALRHIFISFTSGESVLEIQAQWIAVGWIAVLLVGLAALKAKSEKLKAKSVFFALLYLVIPLALLLFLFYRNPKFNARYLMIASPAFFLLLAAGLASLWSLGRSNRIPARGLALGFSLLPFAFLLLTCLYADYNAYFDPAFTKASFREVAQYIQAHIAPGEAVILTSGHLFPAFDYYYHGDAPEVRLPDDPTLNTDHVLGYDTAYVLNRGLAGARGVWVVLWQDEVVDPNGFVPMFLSREGKEQKITGTSFYQVRLRHWTLKPNAHFAPEPEPGVAKTANFENRIELLGFDSPAPTSADAGASFNLYWQALDTLKGTEDYQVALRVRDAAGNLWGKQDRRPAGYTYPTTRWKKDEKLFGAYTVPLLPGAPAGDYYVEVTLYTKGNESGLDVLAPNGAPMGKTVKIGPIPVLPAAQPAALASLDIQHSVSQPIGPFTLLGYQIGRDKASAGETIPLTLFWRADSKPDRDYAFRLQFGNFASAPFPLANVRFPTSLWRAGEVVRGQYSIQVPADAAPGSQGLKLDLGVGAGAELALEPFTVEKTDRVYVTPKVQFAEKADFGNMMALAGYDVDPAVQPGGTVHLTLVWQAGTLPKDKPYTVFVHVLDKANQVAAQKDAQPVNGTRPTTGWVENEFVSDTYELALKPETPPGAYLIEIGWYDASDFSRVPILDENGVPVSDHLILKTSLLVR